MERSGETSGMAVNHPFKPGEGRKSLGQTGNRGKGGIAAIAVLGAPALAGPIVPRKLKRCGLKLEVEPGSAPRLSTVK